MGEGGDHTGHPEHRDDGVGAGHQEPVETGQRRDQADVTTHDGGGGHDEHQGHPGQPGMKVISDIFLFIEDKTKKIASGKKVLKFEEVVLLEK